MSNLSILHNIAKAHEKIVAIAAAEALRFYKQRFVEQNFVDNSTQTWKPTKGRKALSKTGTLKRSVRIINIANSSTNTTIKIGTSEKYAQIHNQGGKITITPKMRKFFWAKFAELSGAQSKDKKGRTRNNNRNRTISEQAQLFKALALTKKKTITIAKRQFIGHSAQLEKQLNRLIQAKLSQIISQS